MVRFVHKGMKTMATEQSTLRQIIRNAKANGYVISVYDGEEWPVKRSDDEKAIFEAATAVDTCTLKLRTRHTFINKAGQAGDTIGKLHLIFGNAEDGSELIADHTANAETEAFVDELNKAMRW